VVLEVVEDRENESWRLLVGVKVEVLEGGLALPWMREKVGLVATADNDVAPAAVKHPLMPIQQKFRLYSWQRHDACASDRHGGLIDG
jgi:hypothetical protein